MLGIASPKEALRALAPATLQRLIEGRFNAIAPGLALLTLAMTPTRIKAAEKLGRSPNVR